MHTAIQQVVKNMRTTFHRLHLEVIRILVLTTCDWLHKTLAELLLSSKKLRFHKIYHHIICTSKRAERE